jgi:hypothetical protein
MNLVKKRTLSKVPMMNIINQHRPCIRFILIDPVGTIIHSVPFILDSSRFIRLLSIRMNQGSIGMNRSCVADAPATMKSIFGMNQRQGEGFRSSSRHPATMKTYFQDE